MNNDVELIPVKGVLPTVQAQSDIVIYVPQAHKNKAGIVKEGDGIFVENGVVSLDKSEITIKSVSINDGDILQPDDNKHIQIIIDKNAVGLSDVDNTSDLDKPISTATQEALDLLNTDLTDDILDVDDRLMAHINDFDNPHRVTKAQVGLSNADNTSDLDKPISRIMQVELDRINGLIKGADKAVVYSDYAELVSVLNGASKDLFSMGQTIFITTKNVPDLWICGIEDTNIQYEYVNDNLIKNILGIDGSLQIGFYKIAALETLEVDLSNLVTLDTQQTITGKKNFTGTLTLNNLEIATKEDIQDIDLSNFVTLDTKQTISGFKEIDVFDDVSGVYFRRGIDSYGTPGIYLGTYYVTEDNNGFLGISPSSIDGKSKNIYLVGEPNDSTKCSLSFAPEGIELVRRASDDINYSKIDIYQPFIRLTVNDTTLVLREEGLALNDEIVATENAVHNNFISYTSTQSLTDEQKEIARNNIGAGTGNGGEVDLSNLVTLDTQQTITGKKSIEVLDSDGSYFNFIPEPYEFWMKAGDDVNYVEMWNTFGEFDLVGSSAIRLHTPEVRIPTETGSTKIGNAAFISLDYNDILFSVRDVNVYENVSKLQITPTSILYNNKEIATKNDIETAITTTLNTAV